MKTPDEIKKALECCFYDSAQCGGCPYYPVSCDRELVRDAREYIRQLEAERNTLQYTLTGVMHFVDKWLDVSPYDTEKDQTGKVAVNRAAKARAVALEAIEQLIAERDAAVKDMYEAQSIVCLICKNHYQPDPAVKKYGCKEFGEFYPEEGAIVCGKFEWRGVQKEDSNA